MEYLDYCTYEYIFAIQTFFGMRVLLIYIIEKKMCPYLGSWVFERKDNLKRDPDIIKSEVLL